AMHRGDAAGNQHISETTNGINTTAQPPTFIPNGDIDAWRQNFDKKKQVRGKMFEDFRRQL
ncbi:MAG: hypothetical protein FWC83_02535, partial [Alphaproteobacteria bacterium]|nr:hypothetical protein [Alphaproteobacteria bacterium]